MPANVNKFRPNARRFLAAMAEQDKRVFNLEDALPYWSSSHIARKALSRLVKSGWLERIERGLYMILPLEAGPEGRWSEDPLILATQMAPTGAVSYWSALRYWGMTEQVPRTTFVQITHRRSRHRVTILGMGFQFITVVKRKKFGIIQQMSDGLPFRITDREKTLIDACDRPDLSGGILQIAQALQSEETIDWPRVDIYLVRMGSGAIYKRLGYLVDSLDITVPDRNQRLERWREGMTQGIASLEPGGSGEGKIDTSWRILVNIDVQEGSR
jgi:predicted transcriptional regulator of viral defense system